MGSITEGSGETQRRDSAGHSAQVTITSRATCSRCSDLGLKCIVPNGKKRSKKRNATRMQVYSCTQCRKSRRRCSNAAQGQSQKDHAVHSRVAEFLESWGAQSDPAGNRPQGDTAAGIPLNTHLGTKGDLLHDTGDTRATQEAEDVAKADTDVTTNMDVSRSDDPVLDANAKHSWTAEDGVESRERTEGPVQSQV